MHVQYDVYIHVHVHVHVHVHYCNLYSFSLKNLQALARLWYHECCRVFQDRLVNKEDCSWFENLLQSKLCNFGTNKDEVLSTQPLLYGDFMVPNSDTKIYEEITDYNKVLFIHILMYVRIF